MSAKSGTCCWNAALLTSTSSRPNAFSVSATAIFAKAGSATSPARMIARRPSASTAFLVSSASRSSSRWQMTMSAPSRANSTATARPMPLSAPVIRAAKPSSLPEPFQNGASYMGAGSSRYSSPGFF